MHDPRNIEHGLEIPSEGYCDQPYIVKDKGGAWVCVMTTGEGIEGEHGQHVIAIRSEDRGRTWSEPVDIEPADGPEASWAMPLFCPDIGDQGRVYAFYTYNAANLREVIVDPDSRNGRTDRRVDTLGEYALKYSDDGGLTWSERHYIPVRIADIDRRNPYQGRVRFFWGVGKPMTHDGKMWLGFAKVGRFGRGFMAESEGWFIRSDNILNEPDVEKLNWQTLPEGEVGLRTPDSSDGPVCDEANLVAMSDGSLFATCRTLTGHPAAFYSRDGGRTWSDPAIMRYEPDGTPVNHPRAANFVRRLREGRHAGKYLYWFHNNNVRWYNNGEGIGSRNPAWLTGGVEHDSPEGKVIHWGRPQVVLYAPHPHTGISYPDFIEEGEDLYISETQKTIARVHQVERGLIDSLFADGG